VVVEVLSDSTEAFDRGAKAAHYRAIPSVRELVFVSQRERMVEVQRRNALGRFEIFLWRESGEVELAALGVALPLAALYRDVL
jgi:Uma2 family endonuclease